MRERNSQSFIAFTGPWLIIFILGFVLKSYHPSVLYFNTGIGIVSLLTLISLWYSSTGEISQTPNSVLASLLAISLKMFACAIILIFYFYKNESDISKSLGVGGLLFIVYTTFEVFIGLKYSKRIS